MCASIFATFGHIKRQTARGPVRLTAGPPRRSAKHHEPGSFRLAGNLRLIDFRQRGFEKPRRDIAFKSMIDCKQSNIHLGATAIGSANRASDDKKRCKHFRVENFLLELSLKLPRTKVLRHSSFRVENKTPRTLFDLVHFGWRTFL